LIYLKCTGPALRQIGRNVKTAPVGAPQEHPTQGLTSKGCSMVATKSANAKPGERKLPHLFRPGRLGRFTVPNLIKYGACCVSNYNTRDG
jgi:hypothetical protein